MNDISTYVFISLFILCMYTPILPFLGLTAAANCIASSTNETYLRHKTVEQLGATGWRRRLYSIGNLWYWNLRR